MSFDEAAYGRFYDAGVDIMRASIDRSIPLVNSTDEFMALISGMTDTGVRELAMLSAVTVRTGCETEAVESMKKVLCDIYTEQFEAAHTHKREPQ